MKQTSLLKTNTASSFSVEPRLFLRHKSRVVILGRKIHVPTKGAKESRDQSEQSMMIYTYENVIMKTIILRSIG